MKRNFDDMMLGSIELFCLAAELNNFTAAATAAGVTAAAVSRSVGRLEERLGVRLFVRNTRQIRLTEGGRVYFEQCRQALSQLVEAEREITGGQTSPSGLLRISVPTSYGHYRLLPVLPEFKARYPNVQLDVHISNRNIDFADERYDLAIRGRSSADSTLIARKMEDAELVLVASPDYLKRAGAPKKLEDLLQHECIQFELPSNGRPIPWIFKVNGKAIDFMTEGAFCCGEDVLGIATLARHGAGIVQTYRYIVEKDLERGELIELLPQFGGASRPFILLYPHARHLSLKVRTLVDFLIEKLTHR
ncbi:LysR family transcriptional regulator [Undibacterium sp.]|jgi:DNA-binding transcriptional LysR family regulator|uniref:LysR family transcriptional regulator n=1 Tax=Undibacterium sp. TaxID=1914977 RepID=UPI002B7A0516|nr:LysR substrate-binding domain-containing protein [Undibacterium sp.]HTD03950.1 LysR substrate-binding domain-containing protein [Undibacterium sp.]